MRQFAIALFLAATTASLPAAALANAIVPPLQVPVTIQNAPKGATATVACDINGGGGIGILSQGSKQITLAADGSFSGTVLITMSVLSAPGLTGKIGYECYVKLIVNGSVVNLVTLPTGASGPATGFSGTPYTTGQLTLQ